MNLHASPCITIHPGRYTVGIEEEVSEIVEEAVEEAVSTVEEEAAEAVEEVGELADDIEVPPEPSTSAVSEISDALDLNDQFRTIAREEAYKAVEDHQHYWPHGETVHVHHEPDLPAETVEDVDPLTALVEGAIPDTPEPEEDEEPAKEHPWYKSRKRAK
jgi:aspartyl/asparaginyl-tRNA synthetase